MDEDLKEMIGGFVEDSREAFDSMEDDLMAMEASPDDPSIMNNLFRVMHTLKGTAGFMGLTEISGLSHKLESVFDLVRQEKMEMTPVLVDYLLPAIDQLKELVFALVGEGTAEDVTETINVLEQIVSSESDAILTGGEPTPKAEAETKPEPEAEAPAASTEMDELEAIFQAAMAEKQAEEASAAEKEKEESLEREEEKPEEEPVKTTKIEPAPILDQSQETFPPDVYKQFVVESEEHLETIEESLLALEENPEASEPIDSFFRAIHSIKGTAAYVNLKQIEILSHRIESIFDLLRKGSMTYTKEIGDVVFKSIDMLRTMVFYVKIEDFGQVVDISEQVHQLEVIISSGKAPKQETEEPKKDEVKETSELATPIGDTDKDSVETFLLGAKQQLEVLLLYGPVLEKEQLDEHSLITLHRALKTLGSGAKFCGLKTIQESVDEYEEMLLKVLGGELEQNDLVRLEALKPLNDKIIQEITSLQQDKKEKPAPAPQPPPVSQKTEEKKEEKKSEPVVKEKPPAVSEKPKEKPKPPEPTKKQAASVPAPKKPVPKPAVTEQKADSSSRISNQPVAKKDTGQQAQAEAKTMRVDASRLDRFMNLIGELIIARNTFKHLADSIDGSNNIADLIRDIKQIENNVSRISDNLQDNLMEMRLVQVKTVFQRMPRIVRDIARKTNKKITLQMVGEHTEVDKSIVEEIGDPLVHIIRNSCDHGIEEPDVRESNNKPEQGTIVLKAGHMGSFIAIDIIDDGKGVNPEVVKRIAVKKDVISQEEAEKMTDEQAVNLIFAPGFSTAEQITDISGRGVGMDVVMTNIRNIQGTVEVKSKLGEGTTVRLKLPLTLAVIEALIIGICGKQYAIPLEAIKETVQIDQEEIKTLKEKLALELRGEILGVIPLKELLQITEKTREIDEELVDDEENKKMAIVVLQVNNREIGVSVDKLYNQQEIVVKPLEDYLATIPGLKGSTIMGDGQVVLILEPSELMEIATS